MYNCELTLTTNYQNHTRAFQFGAKAPERPAKTVFLSVIIDLNILGKIKKLFQRLLWDGLYVVMKKQACPFVTEIEIGCIYYYLALVIPFKCLNDNLNKYSKKDTFVLFSTSEYSNVFYYQKCRI